MKIETKSTVTITMSGAEAHDLCVWMYGKGAANAESSAAEQLYFTLRDLPEEKS